MGGIGSGIKNVIFYIFFFFIIDVSLPELPDFLKSYSYKLEKTLVTENELVNFH
ncbi:hypothetical protein JCM9140_3686 [Halalkalibacter wakoensis JCM 9140]|uniref:Uncharacterized protein n=1 Tax=Halalkalibacter wakoensis JCM 9140 TaxID=1236970 RepID=W4Q840_9BACI|nr:hypothetical protein JCM9140_3686 [Halalkalibacter wakoensis JCM 9140]